MQLSHEEKYRKIKLLGQGSFGKAYLVECLEDSDLCVIKEMDLKNMTPKERKDTVKEAQILKKLKHPFIVGFREVFKKSQKLCIVMDFADGGDLADLIKKQRGSYFKESEILDWFTQLSLALKHVHDRKILHRDLKTQNIFMTKSRECKLGDFGIARVLNFTHEKAKTMVGTPYYLSPEIVESKPYNFKSDIWSLGVVLYELCAQKPPFDGVSLPSLALCIVQGKYKSIPSIYSRDMQRLISKMLDQNPRNRPSINDVLKYPVVKQRINKFLPNKVFFTEFSHTVLHNQKIMDTQMDLSVLQEQPKKSKPNSYHSHQRQKQKSRLRDKERDRDSRNERPSRDNGKNSRDNVKNKNPNHGDYNPQPRKAQQHKKPSSKHHQNYEKNRQKRVLQDIQKKNHFYQGLKNHQRNKANMFIKKKPKFFNDENSKKQAMQRQNIRKVHTPSNHYNQNRHLFHRKNSPNRQPPEKPQQDQLKYNMPRFGRKVINNQVYSSKQQSKQESDGWQGRNAKKFKEIEGKLANKQQQQQQKKKKKKYKASPRKSTGSTENDNQIKKSQKNEKK